MGRKKKSITNKQLEVISTRVNFETYRKLEEMAIERDITMTQLGRLAFRTLIELHERKAKSAA